MKIISGFLVALGYSTATSAAATTYESTIQNLVRSPGTNLFQSLQPGPSPMPTSVAISNLYASGISNSGPLGTVVSATITPAHVANLDFSDGRNSHALVQNLSASASAYGINLRPNHNASATLTTTFTMSINASLGFDLDAFNAYCSAFPFGPFVQNFTVLGAVDSYATVGTRFLEYTSRFGPPVNKREFQARTLLSLNDTSGVGISNLTLPVRSFSEKDIITFNDDPSIGNSEHLRFFSDDIQNHTFSQTMSYNVEFNTERRYSHFSYANCYTSISGQVITNTTFSYCSVSNNSYLSNIRDENGDTVTSFSLTYDPFPVSGVPETATWLFFVSGFGFSGLAARRKRQRSPQP